MYTKYTKQVFNGQGLTRKDDCFHGLLKDWTAAITRGIFFIKNVVLHSLGWNPRICHRMLRHKEAGI